MDYFNSASFVEILPTNLHKLKDPHYEDYIIMKHKNFSAYINFLCNLQKNTCVSKSFLIDWDLFKEGVEKMEHSTGNGMMPTLNQRYTPPK